MPVKRSFAILVTAVFIPALLAARPQIRPSFSAGVDLVPVTVTVQQADGSYAAGLPSSSFRIFDEGAVQPIVLFDAGNIPIDLVLLLDTSASTNARLPTMQNAATRLVRALRPADRAMVLSFGARTVVVEPFTSDGHRLARAIGSLTCDGSTSLYDALYVALHQFNAPAGSTEVRRRALVVFSDGDDTTSLTAFDNVLDQARRRAVAIYTIRLVSPFEEVDRFARSAFELRQLARETGARAFTSAGTNEMANAYEAVAGDLTHQYVLGFVPTDTRNKGFHRISVVVDTPHVKLLTRAGYLAQ